MRKREIAVDLTSLLDVILIILFMFVMRTSTTVANAIDEENGNTPAPAPTVSAEENVTISQEEYDALVKQYDEAKVQYDELLVQQEEVKKKVASDEIWYNTCLRINISIDIDEENEKRIVKVQKKDEDVETYEYGLNSNVNDSIANLTSILKNNYLDVEGVEQVVLFIYSYSNSNVKIKNYKIVDSALKKIQEDYENVYVTYHDIDSNESDIIKDDGNKTDNSDEEHPEGLIELEE
ncbi:MAG: hypothetical protein K6G26_01035 [Lachnospiraceae bacterium]|nr:hypothetical protein [Lachnospiraceae bacterium]